jgi:hypothetical protein
MNTIDVDTGGTFTDGVFRFDGAVVTAKVDTTPHNLVQCFVDCIESGAALLGKDVRDLLQATDRAPLWPLLREPMGLGLRILPVGGIQEVAWFGAAFLVLLACLARRGHRLVLWRRGKKAWTARAVVAAVLAAAVLTHFLRTAREHDLERARQSAARRDWTGALAAADSANHWPFAAHPGRIEYVRAEAHQGLGMREVAEREYAASLAADPAYFWALADLAVCVASADTPREERRRRVAPYINKLRTGFGKHPQLGATLDRIDRALQRSPGTPTS